MEPSGWRVVKLPGLAFRFDHDPLPTWRLGPLMGQDNAHALARDGAAVVLAALSSEYLEAVRDVERRMLEASARQEYEEAARYRDRLGALQRALERNTVVFTDSTDADVTTYSAADLTEIQRVWQIVAEDYAPFDVNVTTADPGAAAGEGAVAVVIADGVGGR